MSCVDSIDTDHWVGEAKTAAMVKVRKLQQKHTQGNEANGGHIVPVKL